MVQRIKKNSTTNLVRDKKTKQNKQDSWCHEALEGTDFLKVVFLFNTFNFLCAGTGEKNSQVLGRFYIRIK